MALSPSEGKSRTDSFAAGGFFCLVALIPGIVLRRSGERQLRADAFEQTLIGYIKSFDRFSAAELAAKTERSEMEVEQMLARLVARRDVDLVFHRPDRTWLHRGRIEGDHDIIERCTACGASIGQQLILRGERIRCTYCDAYLDPVADA